MKAIWKYTINSPLETSFDMPKGAIIRHIGEQREKVCLWVEVDTEADLETRDFFIIGTGHNFPKEVVDPVYLGTAHLQNGAYIFHVYELVNK